MISDHIVLVVVGCTSGPWFERKGERKIDVYSPASPLLALTSFWGIEIITPFNARDAICEPSQIRLRLVTNHFRLENESY